MNPHIIIDAWDFNGFSSECGSERKHGMVGNFLRVKEKGWLWIETSWGWKEFFPDSSPCIPEDRTYFCQ